MSHRRRDVPGGLGLGLGLRIGGPRLGGGGLSKLFSWKPKLGQSLPSTATPVRSTVAYYRNDSTIWQQSPINGERGAHNWTPGGGDKVYLAEFAAVKLSLHSRDLTDAVWVASGITAARDATGIDGVPSSASTLTATAPNGTIFQSFTRASSAHAFQVFATRKTGTGVVEMSIDGGSTYTDITSGLTGGPVGNPIDNPFVVTQTLSNPSIGFRIATSGDEIEVDCAELEATPYATSPMVEESAATISRSADVLTFLNIPALPYSLYCEVFYPDVIGGEQTMFHVVGGGGATRLITYNDGPSNYQRHLLGGDLNIAIATLNVPGTNEKLAARLDTNDCALAITNEVTKFDTAVVSIGIDEVDIGNQNSNIAQFNGGFSEITIYPIGLTDAQLAEHVVEDP